MLRAGVFSADSACSRSCWSDDTLVGPVFVLETAVFLMTIFWAPILSHRGEAILSGFTPVGQKCCPESGPCFWAPLFLDPVWVPFLGPRLVGQFPVSIFCPDSGPAIATLSDMEGVVGADAELG